jgi:hypothetical protein
MGTLSHTAERMAFLAAINAVEHSSEENREKKVLKLLDLMEKYMSDEKLDINFNTAK